MTKSNYRNWNNQPSSEPLVYGVSDTLGGWLGIDKAAEQVISKMGNDLKLESIANPRKVYLNAEKRNRWQNEYLGKRFVGFFLLHV